MPLRSIVAIPVKNEAERVSACLMALAAQSDESGTASSPFEVLLFVNNSDDGTAAIARDLAPNLPFALSVIEAILPLEEASAGGARRHAMDAAASRLERHGNGGVLFTTDADSKVAPNWIASTLKALATADAVAGTIMLDPADETALPQALKERGALEARYGDLVCELGSRLDPVAHDPWPRHSVESGASLALTLASYRAIGGVPRLALGEDRAMVAALRRAGFRVRHAPEVKVVTSGRLVGRAVGGCADTMRRRIDDPHAPCDPYLRPVWRIIGEKMGLSSVFTRALVPAELPGQIRLAVLVLAAMSIKPRFVAIRRFGRRETTEANPVSV